jgi:hypothetical protein
MTLGGVLTAVAAVADWPSPAFKAICAAEPAIVVIGGLVPVRQKPSVAVTVYCVPAVVPVVNVTVAMPRAFVVLVAELNDPPVPVLLQVTLMRGMKKGQGLRCASFALMVTAVPATGV